MERELKGHGHVPQGDHEDRGLPRVRVAGSRGGPGRLLEGHVPEGVQPRGRVPRGPAALLYGAWALLVGGILVAPTELDISIHGSGQ